MMMVLKVAKTMVFADCFFLKGDQTQGFFKVIGFLENCCIS